MVWTFEISAPLTGSTERRYIADYLFKQRLKIPLSWGSDRERGVSIHLKKNGWVQPGTLYLNDHFLSGTNRLIPSGPLAEIDPLLFSKEVPISRHSKIPVFFGESPWFMKDASDLHCGIDI